MMYKVMISLLIIFCGSKLSGKTLQNGEPDSILKDNIASEEVEELGEELDYSKTKDIWVLRENKPEKEAKKQSRNQFGFVGQLIYYIIIMLIIIVVIAMLFFFLSNISDDRSIEIIEEEADEVIEDIHALNLGEMLHLALSEGNYRPALRIEFLQLLKELSDAQLIEWSKEKTNRDYSRELSHQSIHTSFRQAANLYERVWYGDNNITEENYKASTQLYRSLSNSLKPEFL